MEFLAPGNGHHFDEPSPPQTHCSTHTLLAQLDKLEPLTPHHTTLQERLPGIASKVYPLLHSFLSLVWPNIQL
jgi:hypothetical protein